MKLYDELKWRGMIKDVSNEELAENLLNNKQISFYCGFDPTTASLTIGNFVQVIRICLLQKYGHKPIVLVGGATGLIGDPKQTGERKLLTLDESLKNAEKIKEQLSKFVDFEGDNGAIMVNNYDWISNISIIEFLRDYGKNFNINYMLAKDTIASRLETGISYTEFSYMLIQSIDFLTLYKKYNCQLQFGGSDQWGNITAGLELIRKTEGNNKDVLGISSPLLTKSDGGKFGKSETGALWLDKEKTSPYELYQFLINSSDDDVINYLKSLTLLGKKEIDILAESIKNEPEKRLAAKTLSKEVVSFIHGEVEYNNALRITECLFNGNIKELSSKEIENALKDVSTTVIKEAKVMVDLLVDSNIVLSKREARQLIMGGAIMINGEKTTDLDTIINRENAIDNKYVVIRKGKKHYFLIKFEI